MKYAALVLALLVAQLPPPGNPEHKEPAPGQSCVHNTKDPAHHCACQRVCSEYEDDDGHLQIYVQEDAQCRSYCYKDHCHCPVKGCP